MGITLWVWDEAFIVCPHELQQVHVLSNCSVRSLLEPQEVIVEKLLPLFFEQPMTTVETLETMVMVTQQEFSSHFKRMTFFFAHKDKHQRQWFSSVSNIGNMYMSSEGNGAISFTANAKIPMQTYKKVAQPNWEDVGYTRSRPIDVWSTWSMYLTEIQQMTMYEYGFEIRTNGPLEMTVVRNEMVDILGNPENLNIPRIREGAVSLEAVKGWSVDDDGFDAMIKAKQHIIPDAYAVPRMGQSRRKITLD
jgi:hypothetical protein